MFQPIDHKKTADAAVEQIEMLILKGVLQSGDKLPPERDLAAQLNISRPILRDALKELENRALLETHRGGGTYVPDLIGPIFSEPVVELISRHRSAVSDYFEFRRGIEGMAASQAAMRAAPSDIERISEILKKMQIAHDNSDLEEECRLDVALHHAVGESAHNIVLLHTLRSCYRLLENGVFVNRARLYDHPTARLEVLQQHFAIGHAVMNGDPLAARQAAEAHIDFVRAAVADMHDEARREDLAAMRRDRF